MTDVFWDTDRDACAREAAAAIEAVLDQRCPGMKIAFWSAVEKHYRLDPAPKGPPPVPPVPDDRRPGAGGGPAPMASGISRRSDRREGRGSEQP